MRIVYLGSGEFGLPTLETLAARGYEMAAVVTQPDRPAGRGGKPRPTPIRVVAERLEIPVFTPEKPNTPEFAETIRGLEPDLAVVVAYGHLIKKALLATPRLGFVNLHASLLPAYRGAAPVPWAIMAGETVSGATVFSLNERFDAGAVLGRVELPIDPADTTETYIHKLAPLGAKLMAETVQDLAADRAVAKPQDDSRASTAPKLKKEDGHVDWTLPFAVIERRVRALQPWPLASTALPTAKGPLRVNIVELLPAEIDAGGRAPGDIVAADTAHGLVIMAGDRPVRLRGLRPEGKRHMTDEDFLRGTKVIV